MKNIKNKFSLFMVAIAICATWVGCSSDEGGKPSISYIRVTNPAASDSLLVSAKQGQTIVIVGSNLQSVHQIWFNDQPVQLRPTFITSSTIVTAVPTQLPADITNKLKLVFANGEPLLYDFSVDISKPVVDHVRSEYEVEGDSLFFYGDYFYAPLKVEFEGNQEAEIISVSTDSKQLVVKVPSGAQPGQITVTSNFGVTKTNFWYNDSRNIIANFEGPFDNYVWRGWDFVKTSDPNIENINGNFIRINKGALGAWPYLEVYGGPTGGDISAVTKSIPAEAFTAPGNYSLKFEVNTLESMSGATMRLYLGAADNAGFGDARNNTYYVWTSNENTKGNWHTVTIPWDEVYSANKSFAYNENGYGMYIYFHGPNAANYNFAMDNFRVVPNKLSN